MTPSAQLGVPLRADARGCPTGDAVVQRMLQEDASLQDAFGNFARFVQQELDDVEWLDSPAKEPIH